MPSRWFHGGFFMHSTKEFILVNISDLLMNFVYRLRFYCWCAVVNILRNESKIVFRFFVLAVLLFAEWASEIIECGRLKWLITPYPGRPKLHSKWFNFSKNHLLIDVMNNRAHWMNSFVALLWKFICGLWSKSGSRCWMVFKITSMQAEHNIFCSGSECA